MKQLTFVSLVVLLLVGCRKDTLQDRLEGDAANFVGKWEWVHSYEELGGGSEPQYFDIHTPSSRGFTFQIEFLQEGIAIMSKDGTELSRYRMDFSGPSTHSENVGISGNMYRAIGSERLFFGASYYLASPDTMLFTYLPLNLSRNHYKRIQ